MMQQRQCVILQGDAEWCRNSAKQLLRNIDDTQQLYISRLPEQGVVSVSQKQAKQQLGQEFAAVVFDAQHELNPDSFGIVIGTVKAGGVFILCLPERLAPSLFLQRFNQLIHQFVHDNSYFYRVEQGDDLPVLSSINESIKHQQTDDQHLAVQAILKVVSGHRRRPLVLSADRGRGKSASLGIAAAQLLLKGKQRILVTAPSLIIADAVFRHAAILLADAVVSMGLISWNNAEIRFVAPDELVQADLKADLVLVDEAAAIPTSMLEHILTQYSRLVFSTTLHGYEGTGQGFTVRFQKILDQQTPDWHHSKMTLPIRWREDDYLEKFSFQTLLLDACPVENELIISAQLDECEFEQIDRHHLVSDEKSLTELFGLMVLAHYRTRPSDLQMMLDRADIHVAALRYQGHIVASAWLVDEGQLDEQLARAVYAGQRRLKGHLLPQSLLAHAGISSAGGLKYQRIIRIAVHPVLQQRGLGRGLIEKLNELAQENGFDMIGASFAAEHSVINFWQSVEYSVARLGFHKDAVTASHSIMMLKAVSTHGQDTLAMIIGRFQQQWPYLLSSQFNDIEPALLIQLSQLLCDGEKGKALSELDQQEIQSFSYEQRAYESSQLALWNFMSYAVTQADFLALSSQQQQLCVKVILQQQSWQECAKQLNYTGKSQLLTALREAVKLLINTIPDGK